MSVLVDYNQVLLAGLFGSIGNHHNAEISEDMVRHMFLNSLRMNRKKFYPEYGEIIICADGKNSWRKSAFPYYKASRKRTREESELDWGELFEIINTVREELKEFFPYKVLHFDRCEADDIIGVICHEYGTTLDTGGEKFLILSSDKDYIQLQKYANVDQYSPIAKQWVVNSDPDKYLTEHILKGDSGDGIPNILSPDNCLVIKERQKRMTQKRLELYKDLNNMDEETRARYERNKKMIDLNEVPEEYKDMILEEYNKDNDNGRKHLFNFFMKKKLKHLITDIQDF